MLTEEFVAAVSVWIQLLDEWLGIFGQTGGENHELIMFGHSIEEFTHTWSDQNINLTDLAFNFDWKNDVWVLDLLEL